MIIKAADKVAYLHLLCMAQLEYADKYDTNFNVMVHGAVMKDQREYIGYAQTLNYEDSVIHHARHFYDW